MSGLLLESPVGPLWLTAQGGALTGCWFVNGRFPPELPPQPPREADDPVLAAAKAWLEIYFSGRDPGPTPPLAAEGTPFQRQVWRRLAQVPWGTATSYGALAADLAAEKGIPKMSATPSPSSCPATGCWARTAASPATAAGWRTRYTC